MTFASSLSNSILVYYGGAMTLGVMLVVLVILFQVNHRLVILSSFIKLYDNHCLLLLMLIQGMRILPSGRKSSIALVLYGSLVSVLLFPLNVLDTNSYCNLTWCKHLILVQIGVGSFLFSYIPTFLRSLLVDMGIWSWKCTVLYVSLVILILYLFILSDFPIYKEGGFCLRLNFYRFLFFSLSNK